MTDVIFFTVLAIALLFATRVCIAQFLAYRRTAIDEWNREWERRTQLLADLEPVDERRWIS